MSGEGKLARRYARSLFEVISKDSIDVVAMALEQLSALYEDNEQLRLSLHNPTYRVDQRRDALRSIGEKVLPGNNYFSNFIGILAENNRTNLLPDVASYFAEIVREFKKMSAVEIVSAQPVGEDERSSLLQQLQKEYGSAVTITWSTDPSILGGMLVTSGDKLYDASLRGRLESMKRHLQQSV